MAVGGIGDDALEEYRTNTGEQSKDNTQFPATAIRYAKATSPFTLFRYKRRLRSRTLQLMQMSRNKDTITNKQFL